MAELKRRFEFLAHIDLASTDEVLHLAAQMEDAFPGLRISHIAGPGRDRWLRMDTVGAAGPVRRIRGTVGWPSGLERPRPSNDLLDAKDYGPND